MRTLLIPIFFCLLVSCATKKVVQKSQSEIRTEVQNNIIDSAISQKDAVKVASSASTANEDTETTTKEYDTSKPIDQSTGKPPLKSETTIKKKASQNADSKVTENTTEKNARTVVDKTETTSQEKVATTLKETPKTPAIKYWLNLAYLLVAIGVGYVIYKYWNHITKYWNQLKAIFSVLLKPKS